MIDGFRYAAMSKVLLVSFLADLVAMGFGMPRAVFPQAAVEVYGGGPAYGLLSAAIAGGAALGGLLSGRLHGIARQGVAVTVAVCLWGVGVALSGLTSILWLAVVLLAAAGAADLVSSVFRSTMLQTVATDEMRGRMQGVFVVVVAGGPRVADLWHGWAADSIGTGAATTIGGVAVVVGMLAVVLAFPAFWRYRAPTAGAPEDASVGQALTDRSLRAPRGRSTPPPGRDAGCPGVCSAGSAAQQQPQQAFQLGPVGVGEAREGAVGLRGAGLPHRGGELPAGVGDDDEGGAAVVGIGLTTDEAAVLEGVDDLGRRARRDPEVLREGARARGAVAHQGAEGAQLGRGDLPRGEGLAGGVAQLPGHGPEQVAHRPRFVALHGEHPSAKPCCSLIMRLPH